MSPFASRITLAPRHCGLGSQSADCPLLAIVGVVMAEPREHSVLVFLIVIVASEDVVGMVGVCCKVTVDLTSMVLGASVDGLIVTL